MQNKKIVKNVPKNVIVKKCELNGVNVLNETLKLSPGKKYDVFLLVEEVTPQALGSLGIVKLIQPKGEKIAVLQSNHFTLVDGAKPKIKELRVSLELPADVPEFNGKCLMQFLSGTSTFAELECIMEKPN